MVSNSTAPWTAASWASLSFTISWSLLRLMCFESMMPSNHLSAPCPPALNLSQHQVLSQWAGSLHQVAKELELKLQHQSFQGILRVDFPEDWLVWSPCCPRASQQSSPAPHFKSMNSSVLSLLYDPTLIFVHHITLLFKNAEFPSLCADLCSYLNICLKILDLFFFILIMIFKNIQEEWAHMLSTQQWRFTYITIWIKI